MDPTPVMGQWGNWVWGVNFRLNRRADAQFGGLILQHVIRKTTDLAGATDAIKIGLKDVDYWEAFPVEKSKTSPAAGSLAFAGPLSTFTGTDFTKITASDWWFINGLPSGSSGKMLQKGDAFYLDMMKLTNLPPRMMSRPQLKVASSS